jgi:hypothetical protein
MSTYIRKLEKYSILLFHSFLDFDRQADYKGVPLGLLSRGALSIKAETSFCDLYRLNKKIHCGCNYRDTENPRALQIGQL